MHSRASVSNLVEFCSFYSQKRFLAGCWFSRINENNDLLLCIIADLRAGNRTLARCRSLNQQPASSRVSMRSNDKALLWGGGEAMHIVIIGISEATRLDRAPESDFSSALFVGAARRAVAVLPIECRFFNAVQVKRLLLCYWRTALGKCLLLCGCGRLMECVGRCTH